MGWYEPPLLGADLNKGFGDCEWGAQGDEGLDSLLLSYVSLSLFWTGADAVVGWRVG